jgi:ribonuclease R
LAGRLPETAVVQITGTDADGDAVAKPADWDRDAGRPPLILMMPEPPGRPALAPGDKVLARLKPIGPGRYEGRTLKRLTETPGRVLGVFKAGRGTHRIVPTDRRSKAEWTVPAGEEAGAEDNEIVLAEPIAQQHRLGLKPARVIERLGRMGDARSISLIAIHTHDIPQAFSEAALAEASVALPVGLGGRTDLR